MKWDLVNPWARFYQLGSTHPLTALRVRQLNREAESMHQPVQYPLPKDQRVAWANFPLEFLVWALPLLCGILFVSTYWFPYLFESMRINLSPDVRPTLLIALAFTWFVRILFRYRGEFRDSYVGRLLEDLEVSQMRPRAVRLKGKIVGRGEPGAFWSSDFVLRDETGIVFLLYRSSIPFARFLFGSSEAETFVGEDVTVHGWFRRGLVPYVEMSKLSDNRGRTHRLYSRWIQSAAAIALAAIGLLWLTGTF
jgi:hypothetical protein